MTETAVETAVETTTTVDAVSSLPTPAPTPDSNTHKSDPVLTKDVPPVNISNKRSPLGAKILAAPSHLDAFLSHLHRCTKTRGGTDVVLLFTTYALRFTSAVIDDASRSVLHLHARRLIDLFYKLPASSSVSLAGAAPTPALATLALRFSARLKVLVGMLGEWRTMNRMWGVMGMYFAAKALLQRKRAEKAEGKPVEVFDTAVEASQVALLTIYHVSEATAWLSHKKVLPFSLQTQGRLSVWSVQSWAAYVVIDMIKMFVQRFRRVKSADEAENKKFNAEWIKEFLRTSAWAPLTVHWSLPNGLMPEILVAFCALYPSTGYMKDLWRDTA